MFRLIRTFIYVALAFAAGVQFERADARVTCAEHDDWGPYIQCAGQAILAEVLS